MELSLFYLSSAKENIKLDTQLLNQREFTVTVSPQTFILKPFNSHCANREPDMSVVKPHLLQLPPQLHSCLGQR